MVKYRKLHTERRPYTRYQGVFFDFDYTLGDPTPAIVRGYQMGFQALGLEPPTEAQVRPTIGPTLFDG